MEEGLSGPAGAAWNVGTSPTRLSMFSGEGLGRVPRRGLCTAFKGVKNWVGEDGRSSWSNSPGEGELILYCTHRMVKLHMILWIQRNTHTMHF